MICSTISQRCGVIVALCALSCGYLKAQSPFIYTDFHDFGRTITTASGLTGPDGVSSLGSVTFDASGNMYGTAAYGGPLPLKYGYAGMVWELTKTGTYIDLHDFGGTVTNANGTLGPDGEVPYGGVTFDSSGNMYGTTLFGGPNGNGSSEYSGIAWEITKSGQYIDLHDFGSGNDGGNPYGNVALDKAGNLYGVASAGGPNDGGIDGAGMVWRIAPSGAYTDLHDFGSQVTKANGTQGPDGYMPYGGVTLDSVGNLYGIATKNGPNGVGCIWEITTIGAYIDLHDFGATIENADRIQGPDGAFPYGAVSIDARGNLYGSTVAGGANGLGMVWELGSSGTYLDLHDFGKTITNADGSNGPDGQNPYGGVSIDANGNLYGAATYGGPNSWQGSSAGMIWSLTTGGAYLDLHDFGGTITSVNGTLGPDGTLPWAAVSLDRNGNLYGTAAYGNAVTGTGPGLLWSLLQAPVEGVSVSPTAVLGGTSTTGTDALTEPAPWTGLVLPISTNSPSVTVPPSVRVLPGATTATFSIGTSGVNSSISATIIVGIGTAQRTTIFTVNPASLTSLTLNPTTVGGGSSSTGTVTLSGPAGIGGTSISLASSNSAVGVPAQVVVPSGQTSQVFTVTTVSETAVVSSNITASLNGISESVGLSVIPAALSSLSFNPASVTGGLASTGTVTLTGTAPKGGYAVTLTSSNPNATAPKTVTVLQGASTATFQVTTRPVKSDLAVTISAKNGALTKSATLTILPPALSFLVLNPASVAAGSTTTGTVRLTGPAPSSGLVVTLANSETQGIVPTRVKIPAGQTSAIFTVKTPKRTPPGRLNVSASCGSIKLTTALTVH